MLSAQSIAIAVPRMRFHSRRLAGVRISSLVCSLAVATGVAIVVYWRAMATWSADGDPALHLRLIKDIAATWELPRHLPLYPARVADGGEIEAMFPYGYTPLYHLTGAAMYRLGGVSGVLALNALGAAAIAWVVMRFVSRTVPLYVAALAVICAGLSPRVQQPFTSVYMEPMVLGLLFGSVWLLYLALIRRSPLQGFAAGVLIGLAIATRQSALLYGPALGAVVALHLLDRRFVMRSCVEEFRVLLAAGVGCVAIAVPALLYLWSVTGSIGYGDTTIPGLGSSLAIDPIANAYVAGITKPDGGWLEWLDRFQRIIFYGERWLPTSAFGVLIALFAAGIVHLHSRGRAGRFFARWVSAQFVIELLIFVTLHGNARYVVLSQMFFYALVPVGAYAACRWVARWSDGWPRTRLAAMAAGAALCTAATLAIAPPGYISAQYSGDPEPLRTFRARAYADAAAWVNVSTPPDSLFLVPRVYSAELTWERNTTWVTFYGNAWVIDAIAEGDEQRAHTILTAYGVDYVVIQDPPGTYLDRMPAGGLRSFLQLGLSAEPYFTLAYATRDESPLHWQGREVTHGLRIYRVTPPSELAR